MHSLEVETGIEKTLKIVDYLGKEEHDKLVAWCQEYFLNYPCPDKALNHCSVRECSLSVSPVGKKDYKQYEEKFSALNVDNCILNENIEAIKAQFPEMAKKLDFCIGNSFSFDIVPKGNSKSYCLQYLNNYEAIHFFGDKVFPGGNDYEIYHDVRVKDSFHVKDSENTQELIE
jgi:phosphomannomutase